MTFFFILASGWLVAGFLLALFVGAFVSYLQQKKRADSLAPYAVAWLARGTPSTHESEATPVYAVGLDGKWKPLTKH